MPEQVRHDVGVGGTFNFRVTAPASVRYQPAMIGITAAIGEFFAALGWTIVRTGAGVGIAAMIGTATGVGVLRARKKRKAKAKPR